MSKTVETDKVSDIKLCERHYNDAENNGQWKGDKVSYKSLHEWIRNHKHQPKYGKCKVCKLVKRLELCNISGKYLRELKDWEYLCMPYEMVKSQFIVED